MTFGAEFHIAGGVDRIRKYDGPVRVYVDNRAQPDRSAQVADAIADIRARIRDLDIADDRQARRAPRSSCRWCATAISHARSARSTASTGRAASSARSSRNACPASARTRARASCTRTSSIVADAGEFVFYDCVYEELLQSLGPDQRRHHRAVDACSTTTSRWATSIVYDQYLLNILYDRRVQPGMTRAEVQALLPEVLPHVRAWVDETTRQSAV